MGKAEFLKRLDKLNKEYDIYTGKAVKGSLNFELAQERPEKLSDCIKPVYFEGAFNTKIFAYLGIPKEPRQSYPAVVLIHGGNGRAYHEWVKLWVDKGYIAIAFDNNAQHYSDGNEFASNIKGGPRGYGGFIKPTDFSHNWVIHTVENAYRAFAVLVGLKETDAAKIGVCGISWGGYITNVISGLNNPFKYLISVYAGAYLYKDSFFKQAGLSIGNMGVCGYRYWIKHLDSKNYLPLAVKPMLMITGKTDAAFSSKNWIKITSKMHCPLEKVLKEKLEHSQESGSNLAEVFDFADKMIKNL